MCVAGLAALGTADEEVFEDLKNVLYMDDAVAGEAAGIGMGLLCCGSGSGSKTQEMLAYAHDTQVGGCSAVCLVSQEGHPPAAAGQPDKAGVVVVLFLHALHRVQARTTTTPTLSCCGCCHAHKQHPPPAHPAP